MTHAIVLINAERDYLGRLGGHLAEVEGVTEAFSVTGEWDFVAILRVADSASLATVVTEGLVRLPGIAKTLTMVAFEAYSKHDLDAMFDLGS